MFGSKSGQSIKNVGTFDQKAGHLKRLIMPPFSGSKQTCAICESWTIAPTDKSSYAKFDRADSRSYDVLTGRTVTLTIFCQPGQSLLHSHVNPDSRSYIILTPPQKVV
ncbi:hypothetical protein DPMN_184933 [Dreissena polymorpha]|uniref:Uncharacterized protein n=1 Tax=Dreissena polymorpha TaxID=45954 RepID=A0A9D4DJL1_DREPO|nr:hypothetical protein DPMN_184933 [Dreissena polymorpha]